jgi:hypothetical protein
MRKTLLGFAAVAAVAAAMLVPVSNAAKPSAGPTLSVTFQTAGVTGSSMPYGTPFVVSGCGYGTAYTSVVVRSPEALSFAGQSPSGGCISFSNFSTNAAGSYEVDAYQDVHGHSTIVAKTTFTVS